MSLSSLAMCKGRFYLVIHVYLAGWKQKENTSEIRNGGAPLEIVAVEMVETTGEKLRYDCRKIKERKEEEL